MKKRNVPYDCLRDKETKRIVALRAGTSDEDWERLKVEYNAFESYVYFED